MHTFPLRRFTPDPPHIRRGGSVLRFCEQGGQHRTGGTDRDGSDPPYGRPSNGVGRCGFSQPRTTPGGRSLLFH